MANTQPKYLLNPSDLAALFDYLTSLDYQNIGPKFRNGAIMLEALSSFEDIATGYTEKQGKAEYQLLPSDEANRFQYANGPQSFKKFLHPPRRKLWSADKKETGFEISYPDTPSKMAFWGVRNCDLEAIKILDRIFLKGEFVNQWYKKARKGLFVIAVGCAKPSSNCFCTTVNSGPHPKESFDISLIELLSDQKAYYLVELGSEKGLEVMQNLGFQLATENEIREAAKLMNEAESSMSTRFEVSEVRESLRNSLEDKHWDDVANRCLSCANCTMVCPTCFCSTVEDVTDLSGDHTERWLRWDSCFNGDFSYIHGGQIRTQTKSRYRQWLTHKFSSWYDQFGSAGCVGCGRCITWCPVGIDIIEEIKALHKSKTEAVK